MDPRGRAALVSGGAGGLGSAVVEHLVALGMGVVVLDRAEGRGRELADRLGARAVAVGGDATDDDAVAAAVEAASPLGALSVLVNVAGGGVGGGPIVRSDGKPHDRASFADTMEMNALATFNASRLVAAAMAGNEPDGNGERGVIVNIASIAGFEGQRGQVAYAAAKAAILGMTLPMARDLGPSGIRVCAVAPGPMGTPAMLAVKDRLEVDPAEGIVFPPRMGEPAELALLVEAIVVNPYLNGEAIRLDGALRLSGG